MMETWIDFVVARYNYWIVIVLMMLGLYTVFARGNLVKKIVGLNIFQTSVFIFYITMGKIAGGTAPIYIGGELDHGGGHGGDDHGEGGHGAGHGDAGHGAVGNDNGGHDAGADAHEASSAGADHAKIENTFDANDLKSATNAFEAHDAEDLKAAAGSLHNAPDNLPADIGKSANTTLADAAKEALKTPGFKPEGEAAVHGGANGAEAVAEAAAYHSEVIYTNPLPHVLILTAIVVGVAGTAVGLALAVRIREAYGTIEEDELEAMDNVAEFGDKAAEAAGSAGA